MPMVESPPEPRHTAAKRLGDKSIVGPSLPLEALLPSSGALAPAPALAPHRALALDALRLRRGLRNPKERPDLWGGRAFAREVELIRAHLAPLRHRRSLAASFGREAFQSLGAGRDGGTDLSVLGPIRVAYAIRWLELGLGRSLPTMVELLGQPAA